MLAVRFVAGVACVVRLAVAAALGSTLMERFYAHWTTGASKGEALHRAQGEVRATHPDPRYWAAFQLVGAN